MNRKIVLSFLIVALVTLSIVQIMVSHSLSIAGERLSMINEDMVIMKADNEILQHRIASASAIMSIAERAKLLGFTTANYRYIEHSPVALK